MFNIDISLAVLILIFQGGQTVCGVYVTDHNRKRIVATMIVLGVLTVLVGGYVAYRSGEAQAGMINGGDSFTVAKLYSIDGSTAHLSFQQRGDYPLRQVQCTFIDVDKYNDWNIKHPPKRPEDKFPGERTYKKNRIFPVVSGVQAKFVEHHLLGFASSFTVTLVDCSEIFPLRLVPQSTLLKIVFESGYILCVSTAPPPVTFSMARYDLLTRRIGGSKMLAQLAFRPYFYLPLGAL